MASLGGPELSTASSGDDVDESEPLELLELLDSVEDRGSVFGDTVDNGAVCR